MTDMSMKFSLKIFDNFFGRFHFVKYFFRSKVYKSGGPRTYGNENGGTYSRIVGKVPSRFGHKPKIGEKDELGQPRDR